MAKKESIELLIPHARQNPNWESPKAEAMFKKFIEGSFSYDELSNHPDYLAYASAELLIVMLPQAIDEMLRRNDTMNYLIYPMISAIDSEANKIAAYQKRTNDVISWADRNFSQKICRFLDAIKIKENSPNLQGQIERLLDFWRGKIESIEK